MTRNVRYLRPSIKVNRYTSGLPKVIVLHDLAIVSELVRLLLPGGVEVVAETASGRAAVALSELLVPDVVIVGELLVDGVADVYIPGILQTGARVLMVLDPCSRARLLELVELGVTGMVDMDHAPEDLVDVLLELASGGAVLPHDIVATLAGEWRRFRRMEPQSIGRSDLTVRELEVLGGMSDGLSVKAIAHHLGIAAKTVENHKTRIFDKLGVHTQAQAVAMAVGSTAVTSTDGASR